MASTLHVLTDRKATHAFGKLCSSVLHRGLTNIVHHLCPASSGETQGALDYKFVAMPKHPRCCLCTAKIRWVRDTVPTLRLSLVFLSLSLTLAHLPSLPSPLLLYASCLIALQFPPCAGLINWPFLRIIKLRGFVCMGSSSSLNIVASACLPAFPIKRQLSIHDKLRCSKRAARTSLAQNHVCFACRDEELQGHGWVGGSRKLEIHMIL